MDERQNYIAIVVDGNKASANFCYLLGSFFGLATVCIEDIPSFNSFPMGAVRLVLLVDDKVGQKTEELINYIASNKLHLPVLCTDAMAEVEFDKILATAWAQKISMNLLSQALKEVMEPEVTLPVEYTPILQRCVVGHNLPDDLYLKMASGRFVKLFSANDLLASRDIEKYSGKGVNFFYIKKAPTIWKLKETNSVDLIAGLHAAVIDTGTEVEIDSLRADLLGEVASAEQGPFAIEQEYLHTIREKSKIVLDNLKKNKNIAKYLTQISINREDSKYIKNRIGLISNIACAILIDLEWASDAVFEKFVYLAYIHDLTLLSNLKLTKILYLSELEDKMSRGEISKEEKELFLKHPEDVAKIVEKDFLAPQDAMAIILQHHERPNRDGFPAQISPTRIMPFSIVLSIAIDFAHYILAKPDWTYMNYYNNSKDNFKGPVFSKIFRSIESLARA